MAEEWWTSPREATRRLEALSRYYNELRNTALGRGTKPIVSDPLADDCAAEHIAYHMWRDYLPEGFIYGSQAWVDELREWTNRANAMRERLKLELGGRVALPAPLSVFEEIGPRDTTKAAAAAAASIWSGAGGLALLAGVAYVLTRRGR